MLDCLASKGPVLVVAAHPDDEVLGCGGTIARLTARGVPVHTLFLSDGVTSRGVDARSVVDLVARRQQAAKAASEILGETSLAFGDFPDNGMDQVPLLDICQRVERTVKSLMPKLVLTHHGGDLNIDHQLAHRAVITACRPMPGTSVGAILCFETVSSTEWASPAIGEAFRPNIHVDISAMLDRKMRALSCYVDELRPFPHARSAANVESLARVRGASVGLEAAESFIVSVAIAT